MYKTVGKINTTLIIIIFKGAVVVMIIW